MTGSFRVDGVSEEPLDRAHRSERFPREFRRAFIKLAVAGDRETAPRFGNELGGDAEGAVEVVGGGGRVADRDLVAHAWAFAFDRARFGLSLNVPFAVWTTSPFGFLPSLYNVL